MNRLTNLQKDVLVGLAAMTVVIFLALVGYALKQGSQQRDSLAAQVTFLCSTTKTLDKLVVVSIVSDKQNLESGTFQKLVKAGLLPKTIIQQTVKNETTFEHAHEHLVKSEGVCLK